VRPKFRKKGTKRTLVERAEIEIREHDNMLYLHVFPHDKKEGNALEYSE